MKAMMLPLIAFLVTFAIGGGAGAVLMKPAPTAADSTHADSTHADSTHGDTSHAAPGGDHSPTAGSTEVAHTLTPAPDSAQIADDPHIADPGHAPAGSASPSKGGGGPPGTTTIGNLVAAQAGATVNLRRDGRIGPDGSAAKVDSMPDYARLSRLLSKMSPRDAAKTIEQLEPTEAARALGAMSDKQAALVLSQLAPEKAARLLQATLALLPKLPVAP